MKESPISKNPVGIGAQILIENWPLCFKNNFYAIIGTKREFIFTASKETLPCASLKDDLPICLELFGASPEVANIFHQVPVSYWNRKIHG